MSSSISISDQINNQYRTYALYVLQSRGIPNFYDGLTPVQRLILENSPSRYGKTIGLVGEVIRTGLYHHGDSSLAGAISKLARPFGCSFQILEGDGFFGSPVNPNPSAPRYTSVKISNVAKDIIDKHNDLNEKNSEGGHDWLHVEIPLGLLTHVVGIAVGYRSNILPRKLEDIQEYLEGKNKILKPYFKDFAGKITRFNNEERSWLIESGIEINQQRRSIRIFDLPPVVRYESFMKKLTSKLESSGMGFRIDNNSQSKCDVSVVIRGATQKEFDSYCDWISKLGKIIIRENIVVIRDGNVVEFDSIKEYLDNFRVHLETVRLKRLERDLEYFNFDLEYLEAKLKFLIYMSGKKRKNDEIVSFLSSFKKPIASKLSSIQIIKLSDDHIEETKEEIKAIKKKIVEFQKLLSKQKAILTKITKSTVKKKSVSLIAGSDNHVSEIDGVEVFQPDEDEYTEESGEDGDEDNNFID